MLSRLDMLGKLIHYGHLRPKTVGEALSLSLSDTMVKEATESFRHIMLAPKNWSLEKLLTIPRCGEPDILTDLNKVGRGGNWPRCHSIGEFHAANIRVLNNPPAHLARNGNFEEVIRRVTAANAAIGLQLYWSGPGSPIQDGKTGYQLTVQFVTRSSGWIGLAQVASNRPCNSVLWSRYLASYLRSSTDETIRRMWSILFLHELGHNMGTSHTRGGIMNPGILSLPATWAGDPLWTSGWLPARYGGIAIPAPPKDDDWGIYPPGYKKP